MTPEYFKRGVYLALSSARVTLPVSRASELSFTHKTKHLFDTSKAFLSYAAAAAITIIFIPTTSTKFSFFSYIAGKSSSSCLVLSCKGFNFQLLILNCLRVLSKIQLLFILHNWVLFNCI